jgi:hypothetical protein
MRRTLTNILFVWSFSSILLCQSTLPGFAHQLPKHSKSTGALSVIERPNHSVFTDTEELHSNPTELLQSQTNILSKAMPTRELALGAQVEASGLSPQALTGPFDSITFSSDRIKFKRSKSAGLFTSPISAMINGIAFPEVELKKKGKQLFLKGNPGGNSLNSVFPDGGIVSVTIINGDGERLYLTLNRQGESISVLTPRIDSIDSQFGIPGSEIIIRGANFSSEPGENSVIYKTGDDRELPMAVIASTTTEITASIPLIYLSSDLKSFYSGRIELHVETSAGYPSNNTLFNINALPVNSKPVGEVSREYAQSLRAMISDVEDLFSKRLAEGAIDSTAIQKFREANQQFISDFLSTVDNALAGRPTVISTTDPSGAREEIVIDIHTIELFENIIASRKQANQLATRARELSTLALTESCSGSFFDGLMEREKILVASFLDAVERELRWFATASADLTATAMVAGYLLPSPLGGVNGAIRALKFVDGIDHLFDLARLALKAFKLMPGLTKSKLKEVNVTRQISVPVGGMETLQVQGTFVWPLGELLENVGDATAALIAERLKTGIENRLRGKANAFELKFIIGKAIDSLESRFEEQFHDAFRDIIGDRLNFFPEIVHLSERTTTIIGNTSGILIGPLCDGSATVQGLRPARGRFSAHVSRVRAESEASRIGEFEVEVFSNTVTLPIISRLLPESATVGRFPVTIEGQNFDQNTAEVVVYGTGCQGGCTVSGADISTRTPNRIVASLNIINSGDFLIKVRNGRNGTPSNPKPLSVNSPNRLPIAGFTMVADGLTSREGQTLPLVIPQGGIANVTFSADSRSYDPDGGSLRYSWRVSSVPQSTDKGFTFGLGPGNHTISLTVTDNEGSSRTATGTVAVTVQSPSQPLISEISPQQAMTGSFPLTISGTNFNSNNVEVVISGPECSGDRCVVPNSVLTKTATQIIAPVTINNPGPFIITVRNGTSGLPSNQKPLTVTGASSQPIVGVNPASLSFNLQQGSSSDAKILNISNSGGGILNWNASASTSTGGSWLSLSASNGVAPSSTTVIVNSAGLTSGTYTGQITITASGATNSPKTVPVTLTVSNIPAPNAPSISSINPNPPPVVNGNQNIQVNGSNFLSNLTVDVFNSGGNLIGTLSGTQIQGVSANSFTMVINLGSSVGTFGIEVVNPNGGRSSRFTFSTQSQVQNPSVNSVSPSPVPTFNANQNVQVNGSNFQSGLHVDVFNSGGNLIGTLSGSQIQGVSANSFTMVINLGSSASSFGIEVVNPDSGRSSRFTFSTIAPNPLVNSISPSSPPVVNGNQNVQVNGNNFQFSLHVDVFNSSGNLIGTLSGSQILSVTPNSFTMVINLGSGGTFGIEVVNPNGGRSPRFIFSTQSQIQNPSVSSVSPNPVPTFNANQNVQVNGSNFQSNLTVDVFNSSGTRITTLSGTQIQGVSANSFTMVVNLGSSASSFGIEVVNPDSGRSARFNFTTIAPNPSISSISPNPPPVVNGNQNIDVSGSNFQSGLHVDVFNSGGNLIGTLSGSQILNVTPTSFRMVINLGSGGTFGIEVVNPSGGRSSRFTFNTAATNPSISSVSPNPVPTFNANQNVDVFGSNFQSGLRVDVFNSGGSLIGTLSGSQIQGISANSFTMVINLGSSASSFGIEVVNPDGRRSSRFPFSTVAPNPSISSISPSSPPVFSGNQNVQVFGSNFQSGLRVDVFNSGGSLIGTLSGSQILSVTRTSFTMVINLGGSPGTFGIEVVNPSGGRSSRLTFSTH